MTDGDSLVKLVLIALIAMIVVPAVLVVFMMPAMGGWVGGHMGNGAWGGTRGVWAWLVIWLGLLLAIVVVGYLVIRAMGPGADASTDEALEELRLAYARGDLTTEEFEERRRQLEET
ncbi:MAG: SHOCT domain-containing protein [Halobacteriota archaeon]